MNRIAKAINNHINRKHNLTVNVNENEGVVSMSKETFNKIMTEYGQLIYANIVYAIMTVGMIGALAVIVLW